MTLAPWLWQHAAMASATSGGIRPGAGVLPARFPYDPRCFDEVAGLIARDGAHVIVPYLRGYGPSRYRDPAVMRSGQQAALAGDLRELIEGLGLARPIVAGFDWGGRAACVAAMLGRTRLGARHGRRLQRA